MSTKQRGVLPRPPSSWLVHNIWLPFGPRRAPSLFQEMAAVVLADLIYFICEIYLDDCIVHASDTLTFISRLDLIFKRLEKCLSALVLIRVQSLA
jgi:hypothetical protein